MRVKQFSLVGKKEVSFRMTIGNELMHECFPKHLRMGTARNKTEKDKRCVSMERSKAGTKNEVPKA